MISKLIFFSRRLMSSSSSSVSKAKTLLRNANAVCFDVDSTVIQSEGIDDLAHYLGKDLSLLRYVSQSICGCWREREREKEELRVKKMKQSRDRFSRMRLRFFFVFSSYIFEKILKSLPFIIPHTHTTQSHTHTHTRNHTHTKS